VAVFYVLTGELVSLVALLQSQLNSESLLRYVGSAHSPLAERLGLGREVILPRLDRLLDTAMSYSSTVAAFAVQTLTSTLLTMVVGLMTLYAVLLRWSQLTLRLERVLPLERRHTRAVLSDFARVGRVTLMGTFATALVQGALAILGYVLTQTPHALAWGLLTAASTLVPVIGTALVWIPVSAYLLLAGHQVLAIVNLAWGLLVVSFIGDYVIRPRFVGHRRGGSSLVVIVSLLGGVEMFGIPGLVMGPIFMSLFFAILAIYERDRGGGSGETARVWQKCESRQFASRFATRMLSPSRARSWRHSRSSYRPHREIG
jgi:predicted PurR-regulated permease PerM